MAQPIVFHPPANAVPTNSERLEKAPAEHAEALLSAYELLQLLHDRGVLNLLRGAVAAGDGLVGTVTTAVDTPETIGAIRNFILLSKFFASIPPNVLKSLLDTVSAGANREKAHRAPGLLSLLWRLRNEDGRRAASVAIDLFEGLGKGL
jgi:uncharacterized protein YjgD (DUF1641 family)